MAASLDLDAYFDRIGWRGGTRPDFDTLAGLLRAHTSRIPFENLDVLLGRPVRLDLPGLHDKLVGAGRGGYCFEHATLFGAVLDTLGFRTVRHAGRVVLFAPRTEVPRAHMFLTVALDGARFVVDPGFGPFASQLPLPLADGAVPPDSGEPHRMVREGPLWVLRVRRDDGPQDGWVSTLEPENPVDFEVANHFISTHPRSPFVNGLMMSAVTQEGRVNVMNRDVTMVTGSGRRTARLADRAALRAVLVKHFGFDLPEAEQIRVPAIPEWA